MDNQVQRHARVKCLPYLALLASLGLLIYAIPWHTVRDDVKDTAKSFQVLREHEISIFDDRIVRVFVAADRVDEVEIEEWAERPLERRTHSDGTVEYYGISGVAHLPECDTPIGNAGVWIRRERNKLYHDTIASDRELHVHISEGAPRKKVIATK